jgi:hypothetical protein
MSVLRDFIDSNSHTVGGGLGRPRRRNLQSRNSQDDGMTMLVFGFHRGPDFMNAVMALRRTITAVDHASGDAGVFIAAPVPRGQAINVVFTRIVNDYSTFMGPLRFA